MRYLKLLFLVVLIFKTNNVYAELNASQIAEKFTKSVITIITLDENEQPFSIGSGFVINDEGDIATNHHVLEGSAKAVLKTTSGDTADILQIVKDDPNLDLLIAKTSLKNIPSLVLGDSEKIKVGEDVIAIGNPAGLEGTISKGIVSGIRKEDNVKLIQITAPISPGSSGGPVLNMNGEVIGISTSYIMEGQNLNFAMPINYLNSLPNVKLQIVNLSKSIQPKETFNDKSVYAHEINLSRHRGGIKGLDFSIQNDTSHPIKNIKILFIYYKTYEVKYWQDDDYEEFQRLKKYGFEVEIDNGNILPSWKGKKYISNFEPKYISYSFEEFPEIILPKLSLQFSHEHVVKNFTPSTPYGPGSVEARILDYVIVRGKNTSPIDFLVPKLDLIPIPE